MPWKAVHWPELTFHALMQAHMSQLQIVDAAYAQESTKAAAVLCFDFIARLTANLNTYVRRHYPTVLAALARSLEVHNAAFPPHDIIQGHFQALVRCCDAACSMLASETPTVSDHVSVHAR